MQKGSLFVLAAFLLWSGQGIVVRGLTIPPYYLIFYANLISLFLLGGYLLLRAERTRWPTGASRFSLLSVGPVALANSLAYFYAFKLTTVSNALLTHYICPVFVAILAPIFLKESFTKRVAFAIGIAMAGLWVLIGSGASGGESDMAGIASGLASGLFYAVMVVLIRAFAREHDPLVVTIYQNVMMCALLAPFIREFPVSALGSIVVVGILHSTVAPLLYVKGLAEISANRAAILGYMEPVCGIALGAVVLGEMPHVAAYAGGALIVLSGYVVIRESAPSAPDSAEDISA